MPLMMNDPEQSTKSLQFLINLLESEDDEVRRNARKSLVKKGNQAIAPLSRVLENSNSYKARWEAAKALGSMENDQAIPTLIKALEDPESDVAWLAAKALENFGPEAWPDLMHALVKRGTESIQLQHGAHHILRKQNVHGFNDLLEKLRNALDSVSVPESIPLAAYQILEKMKEQSELNEAANLP